MSILFFGHTSFAAKNLRNSLKKKKVFYLSRKKKENSIYFDLKNKKNNLNKHKFKLPYSILFFSSFVPINENIPNWKYISKINIDGIINFLNSLKSKPKKIILISSCAVYGNQKENLSEKDLLSPITPYAITKIAQENIFRIYCKTNKVKFLILRLGYVYGANMPYYRLLKKLKNLTKTKKKINIYNKKLNLNLIHTEDIKNIVLKSLNRNVGIINIVHKKRITLQNFLRILLSKKNPKIKKMKNNEYYSKKFENYFPNFKFYKISEAIKNL